MFSPENFFAPVEKLNDEIFLQQDVFVSMLRLDKVDPVISGNKIFKLHYFLQEAVHSSHKKIITFGGAYSNHLAATAFACKEAGLQCIGIVRGEESLQLSPTLQFCIEAGMQLKFISREDYKKIHEKKCTDALISNYGEHVLIPEGGFATQGAKGAAMIGNYYDHTNFTHVCSPVGTATTFAGLVSASDKNLNIIGISALKNLQDVQERLEILKIYSSGNHCVFNDYHFGGYAKKTNELITFINNFYTKHAIPLDFVYTGKMMFGIYDLIQKKHFTKGSRILCIHTGGLQGNQSLQKGTLIF